MSNNVKHHLMNEYGYMEMMEMMDMNEQDIINFNNNKFLIPSKEITSKVLDGISFDKKLPKISNKIKGQINIFKSRLNHLEGIIKGYISRECIKSSDLNQELQERREREFLCCAQCKSPDGNLGRCNQPLDSSQKKKSIKPEHEILYQSINQKDYLPKFCKVHFDQYSDLQRLINEIEDKENRGSRKLGYGVIFDKINKIDYENIDKLMKFITAKHDNGIAVNDEHDNIEKIIKILKQYSKVCKLAIKARELMNAHFHPYNEGKCEDDKTSGETIHEKSIRLRSEFATIIDQIDTTLESIRLINNELLKKSELEREARKKEKEKKKKERKIMEEFGKDHFSTNQNTSKAARAESIQKQGYLLRAEKEEKKIEAIMRNMATAVLYETNIKSYVKEEEDRKKIYNKLTQSENKKVYESKLKELVKKLLKEEGIEDTKINEKTKKIIKSLKNEFKNGGSSQNLIKNNNKKPSIKKPSTKKPSTKKPSTKKPSTKKPSTKKPSTKKPSTKKPSTKKPSTKKPKASASTKKPKASASTKKPKASASTKKPSTKKPKASASTKKPKASTKKSKVSTNINVD